ncbi:hypothetical protein BGW39_011082 [Mortierella sp. 14UC]|nr:hypothetical protein BGW39_011082 [Mortierella sp. 14UC]
MTIEDIVAKGSTSYWSEDIEHRLNALICYPERFPVRGNLCSDIKRMLDKVARDPTKYVDAVELKHVLKQTVPMREEPILVESAFGRLRIAADKAAAGKTISTIVDEPFVFQAAYNFIKNEDEGFYKHFREQYRDVQDPQSEGKIFERHAPLDLIYAFQKKQLKQELFSILKAAIHRSTTKLKTPIPQFEPSSPSGPDIVFVLRIGDQLYPVFVQNKLLNDIFPGNVEEARLTVHETRLKAYLPNLATYCPGRKYLSLIYAHPAIVKPPREGWNSGDLWDPESEIGTNYNQVSKDGDMPLMQLLIIIDESDMRDFVPGGVADLLDSVKGVKRVHEQLGTSGYVATVLDEPFVSKSVEIYYMTIDPYSRRALSKTLIGFVLRAGSNPGVNVWPTPETVLGGEHSVDMDIFSAGIVFYAMAVGELLTLTTRDRIYPPTKASFKTIPGDG